MSIYEQIQALLPAAGCGRRQPAPHGLIEVSGPDAASFLHRLCSQDVEGLVPGRAALAAFLTPKGKLVATATIARSAAGAVVEVQHGVFDAVLELLDRYHFAEKLELRSRSDWTCAEVLGRPDALPVASGSAVADADGVLLSTARNGFGSVRRHGPATAVDGFAADLPAIDEQLAECLRIAAGVARIGVDTESGTLALEADLDDHVSTTKGCYTGQEIVARIHTYGHVNRRLTLLRLATVDPVEPGTKLCLADGGQPVGRVMSSARVPGGDDSIGLGYLPDGFLAEAEPLVLGGPGGAGVQPERFGPA